MIRTPQTTVGRELERLLRDGVRSARGDAQLLDRYLNERDEAAFEILVERHGPMVLSLCRRYLHDPRDVEDAFQATFLILVRKGSRLRDAASLSSWLYGVAYRVALRARSDVLKRRSREGEPDGLTQAVSRPAHPLDDALEILDAELSRLPEKYRAPLVLCYLEGRTHEQAAADLGWPVGTVRSRMAKARSILEARLTRRGLNASACLAVLRPEFLASSLTSTIPPSLVRATLFATGRFVGLATLGAGGAASLTSTPTSWPATALAQGVLGAMMISQLKWIGVATAAFGLVAATAGIGARAVNTPSRPEDDPRPVQKSAPVDAKQETKSSPPPVQTTEYVQQTPSDDVPARLTKLERKIDRLIEQLDRIGKPSQPAAVPPPLAPQASPDIKPVAPTLAPQASPDTNPAAPGEARSVDAPPSAFPGAPGDAPRAESAPVPAPDRRNDKEQTTFSPSPRSPIDGGLREIEARLMNASDRRASSKALFDRAVISRSEYLISMEEPRVLIARLKGIEDQLAEDLAFSESIEAPRLGAELEEAQSRLEHAKLALQRVQSLVKRNAVSQSAADDAEAGLRVASFELTVRKTELEKLKFRQGVLQTRLVQARRILQWAAAQFKELASLDGPAFSHPERNDASAAPALAPPPPSLPSS